MANKKHSHNIEFVVVGILILVGIVAIAVFVMSAKDLNSAMIQGEAFRPAVANPGDWDMFLEPRDSLDERFTIRGFLRYFGEDASYSGENMMIVECFVDGYADSRKLFTGSFSRGDMREFRVSGIAEESETNIRCSLTQRGNTLFTVRESYSIN